MEEQVGCTYPVLVWPGVLVSAMRWGHSGTPCGCGRSPLDLEGRGTASGLVPAVYPLLLTVSCITFLLGPDFLVICGRSLFILTPALCQCRE